MNLDLLKFKIRTSLTTVIKFFIHLLGIILVSPFIRIGRPEFIPEVNRDVKILYICLAFRGDLILNFPAILALKKEFPGSKITCWVKEYNRSLAVLNRDTDDVICYDDFRKTGIRMLIDLVRVGTHDRIIAKLRKGKFDVCIDDSGYAFTAVTCFLAGIPFRVGRNSQGFGFLYHYEYPYEFSEQLIEKRLRLLKPLGISALNVDDLFPNIVIPEGMLEPVIKKCRLEKDYFTIQPFGGWDAKNWGEDKIAMVADRFASVSALTPVFIGGPGEMEKINNIMKSSKAISINSAGRIDLAESAILISGARIHIGIDSFGAHLAAAAGVKSLTVFGPTNPVLSAYTGVKNVAIIKKMECSPGEGRQYCTADAGRSCSHLSCMRELKVESILSILTDLWEGKPIPPVNVF